MLRNRLLNAIQVHKVFVKKASEDGVVGKSSRDSATTVMWLQHIVNMLDSDNRLDTNTIRHLVGHLHEHDFINEGTVNNILLVISKQDFTTQLEQIRDVRRHIPVVMAWLRYLERLHNTKLTLALKDALRVDIPGYDTEDSRIIHRALLETL